ncbi:CPBP family intramembrane glutamic endopeptidase, partial [Brevundimonas sp.]
MSWRNKNALLVAGAVGLGLLWTTFSGPVLRPHLTGIQTPYLASLLVNLSDLVVMTALILLAARKGPVALWKLAGLSASPVRPVIWAAIILVPAAVAAALMAPVAPDLSANTVLWQGAVFPLIEEVVYRGLAVGALVMLAHWRWWVACLAPALMFGIVHMAQGQNPMDAAGIVAITALGGLLFGWLFVRWRFNLWPPVLLH